MQYKIKGLHCESCVKLIKMELAEIGLEELEVSLEDKAIEIPEDLEDRIDAITVAISNAGPYELEDKSKEA